MSDTRVVGIYLIPSKYMVSPIPIPTTLSIMFLEEFSDFDFSLSITTNQDKDFRLIKMFCLTYNKLKQCANIKK